MISRSQFGKVHIASTLEETSRILFSSEKPDLKTLALRLYVSLFVVLSNMVLNVLHFFFFATLTEKKESVHSIVVYTVGIVGDNVVTFPALAALRRSYPEATITLITNCQTWNSEGAKGLLEPSAFKDRLIILDQDPVQRAGFRFVMDESTFAGILCDLFVNMSPFGNRGWLGAVVREMIFASKLGARYGVGFGISTLSSGSRFNSVQHHFVKNEPRRYREILRELRISDNLETDLLPRSPEAKEKVLAKLKRCGYDGKFLVVMNPGAKFKVKTWSPERFGLIAQWLHEQFGACVVIVGIEAEKEAARNVVQSSKNGALDWAGETSLPELIELLRLSNIAVTNDTGTMHIAAALGVPIVAIFGTRLSPTHWFPHSSRVKILFSFAQTTFSYDDDSESDQSILAISVNNVKSAIEQVLEPSGSK